jgi:hypothetical protein
MRECAKVILGILALTVGASAPALIGEALRTREIVLNQPTPRSGDARHDREDATAEHHGNSEEAQENTSNSPAPFDAQQSPNQYAVTAQPQHQGNGHSSAEWWVAFWTFALFMATTGLWTFTALLWWTTRRAVAEGQQAISAAQASADAAERTVEAMEKTAARQLRAYVNIWDVTIIYTREEWSPNVKIKFKNAGRTPTGANIILRG